MTYILFFFIYKKFGFYKSFPKKFGFSKFYRSKTQNFEISRYPSCRAFHFTSMLVFCVVCFKTRFLANFLNFEPILVKIGVMLPHKKRQFLKKIPTDFNQIRSFDVKLLQNKVCTPNFVSISAAVLQLFWKNQEGVGRFCPQRGGVKPAGGRLPKQMLFAERFSAITFHSKLALTYFQQHCALPVKMHPMGHELQLDLEKSHKKLLSPK